VHTVDSETTRMLVAVCKFAAWWLLL